MTVAKDIKRRLNGSAFITMPRQEITQLVRDVSGEETTRIKSEMGKEIEMALLEQGVRLFPRLQDTEASDNIRFFHTGSVAASFVDILAYPDRETTDKQLAQVITKVKGRWNWTNIPAQGSEPEQGRAL